MILGEQAAAMPEGLALFMDLYVGPRGRISGPSLWMDPIEQRWRWGLELAHPPFALFMVLAGDSDVDMINISEFCELETTTTANYRSTMRIGFGWTPFPGDYRSSGEIQASSDDS